jgi:hypothetical protein
MKVNYKNRYLVQIIWTFLGSISNSPTLCTGATQKEIPSSVKSQTLTQPQQPIQKPDPTLLQKGQTFLEKIPGVKTLLTKETSIPQVLMEPYITIHNALQEINRSPIDQAHHILYVINKVFEDQNNNKSDKLQQARESFANLSMILNDLNNIKNRQYVMPETTLISIAKNLPEKFAIARHNIESVSDKQLKKLLNNLFNQLVVLDHKITKDLNIKDPQAMTWLNPNFNYEYTNVAAAGHAIDEIIKLNPLVHIASINILYSYLRILNQEFWYLNSYIFKSLEEALRCFSYIGSRYAAKLLTEEDVNSQISQITQYLENFNQELTRISDDTKTWKTTLIYLDSKINELKIIMHQKLNAFFQTPRYYSSPNR